MSNFIQVVVLGVIREGNTYLLTKRQEPDPTSHSHGKWEIPGGGLEFGETPEQTLHRELMEEVGIKVSIIKMLPRVETFSRGHWHGVFITYICEMENPSATISLNEEASEYAWFSLDQVKALDSLEGTYELIKDIENR